MNKKVVVIITVLVIIVAITAYMNRGNLGEKVSSQEDAWVSIISDGNETELNMPEIQLLGEQDFEAVLDTSDSGPSTETYTGVPLVTVLEAAGVDLVGKTTVIVKAVDGYTVALTVEEAMDPENVYLAYAHNGELLGRKEDGGKGPYQVILRKDDFSQRWCKFVMEIEVQ